MINLTIGSTDNVYLTLTEKATLTAPNYLFRFVQRTTNKEVRFVKTDADDLSAYPDRYNKFAFDVDQLFCGEVGEYHYYIHQQTSASNLELDTTGKLLETGIMRLSEAAEDRYEFEAYQTHNEYITR